MSIGFSYSLRKVLGANKRISLLQQNVGEMCLQTNLWEFGVNSSIISLPNVSHDWNMVAVENYPSLLIT